MTRNKIVKMLLDLNFAFEKHTKNNIVFTKELSCFAKLKIFVGREEKQIFICLSTDNNKVVDVSKNIRFVVAEREIKKAVEFIDNYNRLFN